MIRWLRDLILRRDGACRCGHSPFAHEHYRPGSDCCHCACEKWRRA